VPREAQLYLADSGWKGGKREAILVAQIRPLGLSVGDRACLALGLALKAPVYTADKSWKKVQVGARIHVIR
jgi:ribonuclease VapC